jgi:glycogen synthase
VDSRRVLLDICLITDVFPPGSGGSGWSTYHLGKALADRGHRVRVLRPLYGEGKRLPPVVKSKYGSLPVNGVRVPEPPPLVKRLGFGRAWEERAAMGLLAREALRLCTDEGVNVLHGQHMVSAVAAQRSARRALGAGWNVASVATVRDYWPLCPTSTRLFPTPGGESAECPDCHRLVPYLRCSTAGKLLKLPLALARWVRTVGLGRALAGCDAVIGVSRYVRDELARSGRVPRRKLAAIPNLVTQSSVARAVEGAWPLPDISPDEPFLLFEGKLDVNKGAHLLPELVARSGVRLPVVVAGDGPLEEQIKQEAERLGLDFRFYGWLDNDAAILLLSRARALLFPSAWGEPLSRVLLEACAAGAAIVALDTGGTSDIIEHMRSGWLASTPESFVEGIRQVCSDPDLNARLREGAREIARKRFASESVSERVESLYLRILGGAEA